MNKIKWKVIRTPRTGKRNWASLCEQMGFAPHKAEKMQAFTITFDECDTHAMRTEITEHKAKIEEMQA